jgi:hypothetical protein
MSHRRRRVSGGDVQIAQLVVSSTIALVVASVGLYIGNNYRMQTRIKLLELRVHAYRSLFELNQRPGKDLSGTSEQSFTFHRRRSAH